MEGSMNKIALHKNDDSFCDHYPFLFSVAAISIAISLCLVAGESAALAQGDQVAEINELTTHVTKLAKNGCYITGTASALIGSIFAVAQQSLKIFGVAAAVTLLAFKAPAFFTSAMLI
jgi:uncharacterized membrane protein